MYKGSLFERLTPQAQTVKYGSEEEALYTSIALNLSRIFSSNAGSAEIALDYGRPDLDNISFNLNESINAIEHNSKLTIDKYEPRLSKVHVSVNKEHLQKNEMSIFIEGSVKINKKMKKISFKADLFKSGGVKVHTHGI
ncbi:type VI secretion system baseplate subunit TssE [Sulfurimonas sp. HSL3-2]|uniref:type VI secretion system baseplate subunit TssE n=1 Tax=Hydrocurvibacter mobilis TaxID=3131936 RepID=UPI0031F8A9E0